MIRLFVMDVDGTLTDGKIYIGNDGEVMKAFHSKDGMGIALLRNYQVTPVIITGRHSEIVEIRCGELKITEIHQGIVDKLSVLKSLLEKYGCTSAEVAYIGDDINDMECIEFSGITACPADAVGQIKENVDFITERNGGEGAVRDFIDFLISEGHTI